MKYISVKKKKKPIETTFFARRTLRARDGAYRCGRGCYGGGERGGGYGGAERRKGRARGTATAPGAWTPDGSIGSPPPPPPPLLYRAALSRQKPCRPPAAARRIAVAAHARPRIELYGTSSRRRYRCRRHHGRRPETPTERSSAAAAVSRGTRVIVIALTHPTDFSVFILRPPDGFFFFLFFSPPVRIPSAEPSQNFLCLPKSPNPKHLPIIYARVRSGILFLVC